MSNEVDREEFPHEAEKYYYTDLRVLRSGAGWYIGRYCWDKQDGFPEPLSRESDYYATKEEAERELQQGFAVRDCPENNDAYQAGALPPPHQPEDN